jgi:alkylresorcinol/alkylpyrone synthase
VPFSRDTPRIVHRELRAAVACYLEARGRGLAAIDGLICHPGGAKVVSAMEAALGLPPGGLDHARAVLRDYGNMSAATVMFVLQRVLAERPAGRYLMSTLGPGFTAAFLTIEME